MHLLRTNDIVTKHLTCLSKHKELKKKPGIAFIKQLYVFCLKCLNYCSIPAMTWNLGLQQILL